MDNQLPGVFYFGAEMTPEEKKEYQREWQRKFRQTEKGKEYYSNYRKSGKRKAAQEKFEKSEKGKVNASRKRQTEAYKARHREANIRYKKNYPEKIKAQSAVMCAVETGTLPGPSTLKCIKCSNQANQYHHHKGYDRAFWLDVVPVCPKCHSSIHSLQKTQNASRS